MTPVPTDGVLYVLVALTLRRPVSNSHARGIASQIAASIDFALDDAVDGDPLHREVVSTVGVRYMEKPE